MNLKRIVVIFYIAYTIYAILLTGTTNMGFLTTSLAILFMWINYIFFAIGYSIEVKSQSHMQNDNINNTWLLRCTRPKLLFIAVLSILFSILSVRYYTGQTPLNVINNLMNNVSVYYNYQNYFYEQQRYIFSISKIPYILMMFFIKFILLYSCISFLLTKDICTKFDKFYLIIITLSYVYIGISRGTSFEFFELLMLAIYILFSKYKDNRKLSFKIKPILVSVILVALGIYIFISGIKARGVKFDLLELRPDVNYNPNGWLPALSPFLALIIFRLYGYFGFGFFYVSKYITDVWFTSVRNLLLGILPMGYISNLGISIPEIMSRMIHIGVRWNPDSILLIDKIGYFGLLMICIVMGILSKKFYLLEDKKPVLHLTNYVILLQMISLPVGNFIFTSSANKLIVMLLIIYWIWRLFINKRIRL